MTAFATSIFCIAAILFLLNFALGLLVQFHLVDTKPFRWLHHALFFAVFVSTVRPRSPAFSRGRPTGGLSSRSSSSSSFCPYVRADTLGHAVLACGALVFYFLWAWSACYSCARRFSSATCSERCCFLTASAHPRSASSEGATSKQQRGLSPRSQCS